MDALIEQIAASIADNREHRDDEHRTKDPKVIADRLRVALGTYRGNRMMEAYDVLVEAWEDAL